MEPPPATPPRGGCNLRPQGLTWHRWGYDCPLNLRGSAYSGGLHPPTGAGNSREPLPLGPRPVHPAWEGPVGAMSQVERRPKARLAVESSFNEPAPAQPGCA